MAINSISGVVVQGGQKALTSFEQHHMNALMKSAKAGTTLLEINGALAVFYSKPPHPDKSDCVVAEKHYIRGAVAVVGYNFANNMFISVGPDTVRVLCGCPNGTMCGHDV